MKKILFILLALTSLNLFAVQKGELSDNLAATIFPGDTNSIGTINLNGARDFAMQVTLSGFASIQDTIAVTNQPVGGDELGLWTSTGTNVFAWSTNRYTTNVAYANSQSNYIIGVTNKTVYGDTVTLRFGVSSTNTYYYTNVTGTGTIVTNALTSSVATNLYNQLAADYPSFTLTWLASNIFQFNCAAAATLYLDSSLFATNDSRQFYLTTNRTIVANPLWGGTNVQQAATNLFYVLSTNYAYQPIGLSWITPTTFLAQATSSGQFETTNSGSSVLITRATNALMGNVILRASNSLDQVTWFLDTPHTVIVPLSGSGVYSNWPGLGAVGWVKYILENTSTNGSAKSFRAVWQIQ